MVVVFDGWFHEEKKRVDGISLRSLDMIVWVVY